MDPDFDPCTAFDGLRRIASGALRDIVPIVKAAIESGVDGPVLVFDDTTGCVIDIEAYGRPGQLIVQPQDGGNISKELEEPRGRGRAKMGAVAREVSLLPRHWDWLGGQPGGASTALRDLIDAAIRRELAEIERRKNIRERAYRFMATMAGDLAGFDEASWALFTGDRARFEEIIGAWPEDIKAYIIKLVTR